MSAIYVAALHAIEKLYHTYHIGLLATALLPFCMIVAGFFHWRWQKQRSLLALLDQSAKVDHQTQFKNREGMNEILLRELKRAQRYKSETSVLMIDIDHFKSINELYGKKVGDRMILHIGKILSHSLRASDSFGRFGGEEFMVILPETSEEQAALVAERLRKTVLDYPLIDDAEPVIASVSIGVAAYSNDMETPFKVISHSGQALYHAKSAGRNQVHCWAVH